MDDTLKFVKDWLPSVGVVIAGAWIFFKWLFEEKLREKKEAAALEGKLSASYISLSANKKLVTIEGAWHNLSPLSLYLDTKKCCINIYRIPADINLLNCSLTIKSDLGTPLCNFIFLPKMIEKNYFLEPNTQSTIINHFILEDGIYAIRMMLHGMEVGEQWWKEIIIELK